MEKREALPDLEYAIEDIIAEDDKVSVRWMASGTNTGELMGMMMQLGMELTAKKD